MAVTGATGFLGSALALRLRSLGWSVTGLARRTSAPATVEALRRRGVRVVEGDITRPASLLPLLRGADVVLHCAAVIGYRRRQVGAMARTNVMGTEHVARACLRAGNLRLVHVSSVAAVGVASRPVALDETAVYNAGVLDAAYFDTKHEAEQRVGRAVQEGLDAVVVNPAMILGAAPVPSNSSRLLAAVWRGRVTCVPTVGVNVVPLPTVVEGILAALARGRTGRRYILGGENLTLQGLVRRVGAVAGRELRPRLLSAWVRGPARLLLDALEPCVPDRWQYAPHLCSAFGRWLWYDSSRARDELGLRPEPLDGCLRRALEQHRSSV